MLVERNIAPFVVFQGETLLTALGKMSGNKSGFLCVIDSRGHATGILTDGDVRRWLTSREFISLEEDALEAANADFTKLSVDADARDIEAAFSSRIRAVPLLDAAGRVAAIAFARSGAMAIGDRRIGAEEPCYIIAEIGNNHQGELEIAKRLIDVAVEAGADCAKFQMRDMTSLYRSGGRADDPSQDLGAQYTLDLLARFNLGEKELFAAFDYCQKRGIEPLCTPWDLVSLEALERYGMRGYKIASADLTNHELVSAVAATGKPLICSTGMAREAEIKELVQLLRAEGAMFSLLHTNSTYPAPFKDINLQYMDRLAEIGGCPCGYSGHERGIAVPIAAVARGANIIEKHITEDRSQEGNDHKVSLLPLELGEMVRGIRAVEESLGSRDQRTLTQGELMNREILAKSLQAAVDIPIGTEISDEMIVIQSPGQGLQPNRRGELIGRVARRDILAATPFFPTDLEDERISARHYKFDRPWGIPVRWHDYKKMLEISSPDFLEYHLSYRDMEVELKDWFVKPLNVGYVVHAPELFKGDHTLDLAATDVDYRRQSIDELQRLIDLTRDLKQWHNVSGDPLIVTNMGGFSTAHALPVSIRPELYERIEESLAQLDLEGVEIVPQTMPPYPWHFGGQSYHNLFMDPNEIAAFCEKNKMRVCLDVSHSQLACNAFKWSMKEFCEVVGPHTAHLHIVDALGVDGEGMQIGEGNIDFHMIAEVLRKTCPNASFVPEIWQGHKDSGLGFWIALDRLETLLANSAIEADSVFSGKLAV
ncbi:N-acetylneuraminate synthase family protein [Hephaestia sp. CMS5P-6]|nr:N-acetylneuraminate synthase family protein [Hephaestia mangrovi]